MYCCGRLYCLSLLFKFDRGVVCIVVVGYVVYHYCLRFDRGVVCIVVVGYIVYHYCLRFDQRGSLYCCGRLYCLSLLFKV